MREEMKDRDLEILIYRKDRVIFEDICDYDDKFLIIGGLFSILRMN